MAATAERTTNAQAVTQAGAEAGTPPGIFAQVGLPALDAIEREMAKVNAGYSTEQLQHFDASRLDPPTLERYQRLAAQWWGCQAQGGGFGSQGGSAIAGKT